MIKDLDENEVKKLKEEIIEKHGTPQKLKQRTSRTGCRNPDMVDDYMIYKALDEGGKYRETRTLTSFRSISALTPKRIEIIDFLTKNDIDSINDLAKRIDRDYKNVYDDIKALVDNGYIDLKKEGKSRKPTVKSDKIIIDFS